MPSGHVRQWVNVVNVNILVVDLVTENEGHKQALFWLWETIGFLETVWPPNKLFCQEVQTTDARLGF